MSNGKERPTAALVLGIINIAWGLMGICGGIGMFVFLIVIAKGGKAQLPADVEALMKIHQTINIALAITLITGGFGLIFFKNWGRILSFVYAGAYIPLSIWGASMAPKLQQAMQSMTPSNGAPPQIQAITNIAGTAFGLCCGLIYPIVLLVILNLKSVREAFTSSDDLPPKVV